VGGAWVVREGRHRAERDTAAGFSATLRCLLD
jgi:hypothetical protein